MTPADRFYLGITCCHRPDCADVDCPGRKKPEKQEPEDESPSDMGTAFKYVTTVLAGIGVFSLVMAIVIWSVK